MKPRRIFNLLLIVIAGFLYIQTGEKTSTHDKLTGPQKGTLAYAKYILKKYDNKIVLPLEINTFMGDTVTKEQYKAIPLWEDAYFEDTKDFKAILIIPLTAKTTKGDVNAVLNIMRDDNAQYLRIVNMALNYQEEKDTTNIYISSNLDGVFLHASVYVNGKETGQLEGLVGMNGVCDNSFQNKNIGHSSNKWIRNRFFNIQVMNTDTSKNPFAIKSPNTITYGINSGIFVVPGSLKGYQPRGN